MWIDCKNEAMIKVKPPLINVISLLMLAATFGRAFLQTFEPSNPYRWLISGLLALFGILLFSEINISRVIPSYLKYYFLIQASIVISLILLPLFPEDNPRDTDFFALLFIPLCVQVIFYFKRPINFYWFIALTIASVTALQFQYGLNQGLKFSITYIISYSAVGFLALLYIDAEEAKNKLKIAHQKLRDSADKVEELAIAEERNRLARDLHDSVTQSLYSLMLFAEAASEELSIGNTKTVVAHIDDLRRTAQEALQEMRTMVFELRPPEIEEKGFIFVLQERLESVESRTITETEMNIQIKERLPIKVEIGLYGIAREALNNILKHSQATKLKTSLVNQKGMIVFEIQDNGVGLDLSQGKLAPGLGIKGMRERAAQMGATLSIENAHNGGTLLRVEVPDDRTN